RVECAAMDAATGSTTHARTDESDAAPRTREWVWMLRVLAVVVVFAVITVARSRQVAVPFRDPHGKLFTHKILSTADSLLVFVAADVVVRGIRARRRGTSWWAAARARWT